MKALLVTAAAIAVGAGAGWYAGVSLAEMAAEGRILVSDQTTDYETWQTSQALGSVEGDPVLIAWIARTGILPLAQSEAVYFFTDTDSDLQRLDPDCTYEISVPDTSARWWSVTVYDEARMPIENRLDRYSFNSDSGVRAFTMARNAPAEGESTWLPLGDAQSIELLFRVYQPGETFDPAIAGAMPRVERSGSCSN